MSKEFKSGDRVVYIGNRSEDLFNKSGTVVKHTSPTNVNVVFDGFKVERGVLPCNVVPVSKPSTDDSGNRGMKFDGGKPRMALLLDGCPNALEAVGKVLTFGAQKYAAHSWQGVPEAPERYKSALMRHLLAIGKGEVNDPESGLPHLAHVACNALFILELHLKDTK